MKYELITYVNGIKTGTVGFKSLKDLTAHARAYTAYHAIDISPLYLESAVKRSWDKYLLLTYIWTYKA